MLTSILSMVTSWAPSLAEAVSGALFTVFSTADMALAEVGSKTLRGVTFEEVVSDVFDGSAGHDVVEMLKLRLPSSLQLFLTVLFFRHTGASSVVPLPAT